MGARVPEVLLSGHHEAIRAWRLQQALGRTWERRPDLLRERVLSKEESELLAAYRRERKPESGRGRKAAGSERRMGRPAAGGLPPDNKPRASGGALRCAQGQRPAISEIGERSMDIIATLEKEEIERLGKKIPVFAPGDTVIVNVSVVEGERKRVQAYEGVVIAKRNRGLNSSFVVRKISSGEGVERTFQTYSPLIAGIEVKRKGDVRRAKLYYLRDRSGKSARIREKLAHTHKEKQE